MRSLRYLNGRTLSPFRAEPEQSSAAEKHSGQESRSFKTPDFAEAESPIATERYWFDADITGRIAIIHYMQPFPFWTI